MVNIILPDNSKMNPPTQKEIRKKQQEERKHLKKHGDSPIDKRLEDNRKQQWTPENTKYYLNTVIRDITPFLTTDQLLQLVKVMCDTFNCVECTKTKRKDNPQKYNAFLINEFIKTFNTLKEAIFERDLLESVDWDYDALMELPTECWGEDSI